MKNSQSIITAAKNTLQLEADAVNNLKNFIDNEFVQIVEMIHNAKGRLIVTGIGKSANIAHKIVATMNSTGTPAVFMHAADAIHGDLGNVQKDDIVLCISKSGNSPEIKVLAPLVNNMGNKLIGMVGNVTSYLAKKSDYILNTTVEQEACPNGLAPTTSTTAQLAMGDALAVSLMELSGFTASDFAKYHPGGALGKKLFLRLQDVVSNTDQPIVSESQNVEEVIIEISQKRLGATAVIKNEKVVGIITDGDLRRMLQNNMNTKNTLAKDIMTSAPTTIDATELAFTAFNIMEEKKISQIIVTRNGDYVGIVHLHDILKEGIF